MTGLGFCGVLLLVVEVNGNGCSEQTNLASTPADRSSPQNNWEPMSLDPSNLRARS